MVPTGNGADLDRLAETAPAKGVARVATGNAAAIGRAVPTKFALGWNGFSRNFAVLPSKWSG
jgi:hypothetical protein